MGRMTVAQVKILDKLSKAHQDARDAVYACAKDSSTRFDVCYELAPKKVRVAYDTAQAALTHYEQDLVRIGRGYFSVTGTFTPAHN